MRGCINNNEVAEYVGTSVGLGAYMGIGFVTGGAVGAMTGAGLYMGSRILEKGVD
jgi:hypothetical protein